ncbi:hypothetical protein [Tenacibaculum amylolyticum]|uniref:hypothetical protein n=1 Tax=Tenacibaculum amylolyticum TaxID=104269 RepID=UPI00389479A5
MNWCIIIPILVGLISALLGYLLGRLNSSGDKNNNDDLTLELELRNKIAHLEASLNACNKSKLSLESNLEIAKKEAANAKITAASLTSTTTEIPFDAAAAKAAFGKKIKQNDLKIVEGIGPKIEGLFHNFNIKTWKALSEASIEKCQEVLQSGGDRYRIHKPDTWPEQAKLAYEGKWKQLAEWQDKLDGGKA